MMLRATAYLLLYVQTLYKLYSRVIVVIDRLSQALGFFLLVEFREFDVLAGNMLVDVTTPTFLVWSVLENTTAESTFWDARHSTRRSFRCSLSIRRFFQDG
jgi:hypothetical protein